MSSNDGKWNSIQQMWAGLGLFLFFFGLLVLLPMWNSWQETKVDREIVRSCATAESRGTCIKETRKALD